MSLARARDIASETVSTGGLSTTTTSAAARRPARAAVRRAVSRRSAASPAATPAATNRSPAAGATRVPAAGATRVPAAGATRVPAGVSADSATSSTDAAPASSSLRPARSPESKTSVSDLRARSGRLAQVCRRSASTAMTHAPAWASARARLAVTQVRPSKPCGPVTSRTVPPPRPDNGRTWARR